VFGHHLFVGGDHIAAAGEGLPNETVSGILTAQQLYDDVHIAGYGLLRIVRKEAGVKLDRPLLVQVTYEDTSQREGGADTLGVGVSSLAESAGDAAANDSQPQQHDIHTVRHGTASASPLDLL
jgi:hypothetical protein